MAARNDFKALVSDMAEKMYSERYLKKYRPLMPLLTLLQKPKDVPRFVILANACKSCDTYGLLDKIKCKTLVLGGKKDLIVSADASEKMAKKLGCDIYMYDDLGHAAYEEADDFNKRIYDFFNKTE